MGSQRLKPNVQPEYFNFMTCKEDLQANIKPPGKAVAEEYYALLPAPLLAQQYVRGEGL
jgi:hypothetical protein